MAFPLTDLKRSYSRRPGQPATEVRLHLLRGHAVLPRTAAVIACYEGLLGRPRSAFDPAHVASLCQDYRLARCLQSCLERIYSWEVVPFGGAVAELGAAAAVQLEERGVASSHDLRLLLYDHVNVHYGGFLAPADREATLAGVAGGLGLSAAAFEQLLTLDADEHAVLRRRDAAPNPEQVAALYNRRAVETLLLHASEVRLTLRHPTGTDVKRLYFLVKRSALVCELEAEDGVVHARVHGPLEVFGSRVRHGHQLARVAISLLGAGGWRLDTGDTGTPGRRGAREPSLECSATVHINDRQYVFSLNEDVQAALRRGIVEAVSSDPQYDSAVESAFAATFEGMARREETRGWRLLREPDPLFLDGIVFVPDFAFERETDRVYLEIIGFWTLSYREKKKAKLRALAGHVRLLLAVQEKLAADFADLPLPLLVYRHRLSATQMLRLLDARFDRPAARARRARSRLAGVQARLAEHGCVPDGQLRELLGVFADEEVRRLADSLETNGARLVRGAGLCSQDYLAAVREAVDAAGGTADVITLEMLRQALRAAGLPAAADHVEPVLLTLGGYEVAWESLFEATVSRRAP